MGIHATVEGNLLKNPVMRSITVAGAPRNVVDLAIFADVNRRVGESWEQDDDKSGPVYVTIWQERLGDDVMRTFRTGARVVAEGDMHLHTYTDKDGDPQSSLNLSADWVAVMPYRIETITYARRSGSNESREPASAAAG
jgi:single-stranded DNA-binding protein